MDNFQAPIVTYDVVEAGVGCIGAWANCRPAERMVRMALDGGLARIAASVRDLCGANVVTDTVVEAGLGWIRAYASFRRASGGALGVGGAGHAAPVKDPCGARVVTDTVVEAGGGSGAWTSRHCRRHNGRAEEELHKRHL